VHPGINCQISNKNIYTKNNDEQITKDDETTLQHNKNGKENGSAAKR
jgi:hypothetical protein